MKVLLILTMCLGTVLVSAGETAEQETPAAPERSAESVTPEVVAQDNNTENTSTQKNETPAAEPRINTSLVLGMNVRGNKESPLSLTIVPWRSADHNTSDPQIMAAWRPELGLLQPEAYRRNINAFLKSRQATATGAVSGTQNENQ